MQQSVTLVRMSYTKKQAEAIVGTLSAPSKMPCHGYSIPAKMCITGSVLRHVEGSVCSKCYALKGRYVFPNVQAAMQRRANSIDDPRWEFAMAALIASTGNDYFRWHDSGDIQSLGHLLKIVKVAELTPQVTHWLPTREFRTVDQFTEKFGDFPDNLIVRVSAHQMGERAPRRFKHSSVVHTDEPLGFECRAPYQGNQCKDCRACWNREIHTISYHAH